MMKDIGSLVGVQAKGMSLPGSVSQRTVSALMLIWKDYTTVPKVQIGVNLNLGDGSDSQALIPNLQALPLVEMSDYAGGTGYAAQLEIEQLEGANANAGVITKPFATKIPLGNIHLGGKDSLDFAGTVTTDFVAGDGFYAVWLDGDPTAPERIIKYENRQSGEAIFADAEAVFAFRTSAKDANDQALAQLAAGDVNVTTSVNGRSEVNDLFRLYGYTCANGKFEMGGPRRTCIIYERVNPVSETVSVSLSGNDAGSYSVLGVHDLVLPGRAALKAVEVAERASEVVKGLESSDPAKAKALVLSGRILPSFTLAKKAEALRPFVPSGRIPGVSR